MERTIPLLLRSDANSRAPRSRGRERLHDAAVSAGRRAQYPAAAAASLHDTQAGAEAAARAQAKRRYTELVTKGKDARILRRDSYGGDPARRPG